MMTNRGRLFRSSENEPSFKNDNDMDDDDDNNHNRRTATKSNKTPVHLLAGFLGAGKTSTLQHMLENTDHMKIGIIVNDGK
jgi:type II secretory ATPase GspE/PulE/Tfp pilus assembly ATPase PilB-like protein